MLKPRQNHRLALLLSSALALGVLSGCGKKPAKDAEKPPQAAKPAADPQQDAAPEPEAAAEIPATVYGLAVPPGALHVSEGKYQVRVKVRMPLQKVGEFLEQNLVDFEVLYPKDQVRAVGLRSYMPSIYVYPQGPFSFLVYSAPEPKPQAEDTPAAGEPVEHRVLVAGRDVEPEVRHYKKGDPILERTQDGRLLAPGARWGEPYTPPPGSPLDQAHFRTNFGRPFGQWVSH